MKLFCYFKHDWVYSTPNSSKTFMRRCIRCERTEMDFARQGWQQVQKEQWGY